MVSIRVLAVLGCVAVIAGCAPQVPPAVPRQAVFVESEYAPYSEEGNCTIAGQAFLKTRSGDVKYGAGNAVYCNPVTTYSREWFERAVKGGERLAAPDAKATSFVRQTVGDGEGRFRFENLPPGDYYLACPIQWEVPNPAYTGNPFDALFGTFPTKSTGGIAYSQAHVDSAGTVQVILTR